METDLKKIIKAIISEWKFIFKSMTVISVTVLIYLLFFYSPTYTSKSKVYLSKLSSNEMSLLSTLGMQTPFLNSGSAVNKISIIDELLGSYSFLVRMLEKDVNIDSSDKMIKISAFLSDNKPLDGDKHVIEAALASKLRKKIIATTDFESSIVTIKVESENKYAAQDINSHVIDEINQSLVTLQNQAGEKKLEFIEERMLGINAKLSEAEQAILDFRYTNKNITSSPTLQMNLEKLVRNLEFHVTLKTLLLQEREFAVLDKIEKSNAFTTLEKPTFPATPSSTRRLYILIAYLIVGLIFSITFIVGKIFYRNLLTYIKNF
tara:strand:+ start:507 stop:1466 length:960 start_codon:yes stop_codon:yes gene_type:complete